MLDANKHHSRRLQFSYNKHGSSAFVMKIIEVVSHSAFIHAREQYWIERHGFDKTYNSAPVAMGATRIANPVYSIDPKTGDKVKFASAMTAAEMKLGSSEKLCQIRKAIYSRRKAGGVFWTTDEGESLSGFILNKRTSKSQRWGYRVFAWTLSGKELSKFSTIAEAAKYYGVNASGIHRAIRSEFSRTCGSMLWSAVEVAPSESHIIQRRNALQVAQMKRRERELEDRRIKVSKKKVLQVDRKSGEILAVHESLSQAARTIPKATLNGVSEAARKVRSHHAGYIWEFVKS